MPKNTTTITVNGVKHKTLKDILPPKGKSLKILFIGKTPALKSVEIGHYFQGNQGKFFWGQLREYGILTFNPNTFEDENLIENGCGFTDIVKIPRNFGKEPSDEEYKRGLDKVLGIIQTYRPKVIVFVYKAVLDNILKYGYATNNKSTYGFNSNLKQLFKSQVFVFPMSGTPCTKEMRLKAMSDLNKALSRSVKSANHESLPTNYKKKTNASTTSHSKNELKLKERTIYTRVSENKMNDVVDNPTRQRYGGFNLWLFLFILLLAIYLTLTN